MKQSLGKDQLLHNYLLEILKENELVNLTSITDPERAQILMVEDSLAALPVMIKAPKGRYGDLGTGAGFPGVPLGLYSKRETLLIDSRQKKIDIINKLLNSLNFPPSITGYCGRIETLAQAQPKSFSVLTARALTNIVSLLELASPLLCKNGLLISFHSSVTDETLLKAREAGDIVGMTFIESIPVQLSDHTIQRTLLVFKKTAESKISLPRRVGVAQKRPLT